MILMSLFQLVFTRPKRDTSHSIILNLKKLNEHIVYRHFEMDSLQSAVQLMKPHCWNSVPNRTEYRKYLRFEHDR